MALPAVRAMHTGLTQPAAQLSVLITPALILWQWFGRRGAAVQQGMYKLVVCCACACVPCVLLTVRNDDDMLWALGAAFQLLAHQLCFQPPAHWFLISDS